MDPDYIMQWVDDKAQLAPPITVDLEQAREVAQLFATIVDAKSPYTAEHSHRVAAITKQLGEICGFSGPHLVELEIAALLHDIGKLRVPDELIEYPGELSAAERSMMRRHSFDTHTILSAAFPGSQIAIWASSHHENNDGSGYPNRLLEQDIPTEAQLIHIADYMQALAQKRPYKPALSAREVAEMIRDSVAQSKISPRIYAHVEQSFDQLFSLATGAA
jgi:HD-GYP domain-containing protein (c-di-GMP phosphodiesterase class II)